MKSSLQKFYSKRDCCAKRKFSGKYSGKDTKQSHWQVSEAVGDGQGERSIEEYGVFGFTT